MLQLQSDLESVLSKPQVEDLSPMVATMSEQMAYLTAEVSQLSQQLSSARAQAEDGEQELEHMERLLEEKVYRINDLETKLMAAHGDGDEGDSGSRINELLALVS